MNDWTAHKTGNEQGADFKEIYVRGKISELQFTIRPHGDYWRAGFKLVDPNDTILPLRNNNSLLFHLGSTTSSEEYGFTAYRNGEPIKELNKTKKYPQDKALTIKLEINHNNFLKVFVNGSLEFKPIWHLENPNIREKSVLIAWGDENNYEVNFEHITAANWKDLQAKTQKQSKSPINHPLLQVAGNENVFFNSRVEGSAIVSGKKNTFSKIKISNNNNKSSSHWYKDPKIMIPATVTLLAAFIGAPWLAQVFQKTNDKNLNLEHQRAISPTISTFPTSLTLPTQTKINESTKSNLITIGEGKSFTDTDSGITIGVNTVLSQTFSNLTLTFPGKESEEFREVKSGRVFYYKMRNGIDNSLTIVEINLDSIKVKINNIFDK